MQACHVHPKLAAVCRQFRVNPAHLERRVRQVDHRYCLVSSDVKPQLSQEDKDARYEACEALLLLWARDPDMLHRVVWVDESSVSLTPAPVKHIARRGEPRLPVSDERVPAHAAKTRYLYYVLCVNSKLGLVHFQLLTGSAAFESGMQVRTFLVVFYSAAPSTSAAAARAAVCVSVGSW